MQKETDFCDLSKLFRVWYIINAMRAPGVAAQDAAHCQPAAFKRPMTFQSG